MDYYFIIYIVNYFTFYTNWIFFVFFALDCPLLPFLKTQTSSEACPLLLVLFHLFIQNFLLSGCYVGTVLLSEDGEMGLPEWSLWGESQQAHTHVRCEKCHEWRDEGLLGKAWSGKTSPRGDIWAQIWVISQSGRDWGKWILGKGKNTKIVELCW